MELLLPTKISLNKKYKHFTVESKPSIDQSFNKRIEFFYIGSNNSIVDLLVRSFEGGYAFENTEVGISFLKRNADRNNVPGLIIVNSEIDESSLNKLNSFLKTDHVLASVPVMLDGSGLSENEISFYRSKNVVDEILFLDKISKEKIISKANFISKVKARSINGSPIIKSSSKKEYNFSLMSKRLFDILLSSIAILFLSPVFLIIAVLIKLESKGSIFYIAPRAGKGYKVFNFYKFRTMVVDADKKVNQLSHLNQYSSENEGPVFFKVNNDPRVTKIGAFLRNSSLDELPQLLNVFLGDMSLVGNRPLPLYEAATLTTNEHAARFLAPAGITGLWQIKKRGDCNMSVEDRIGLDIDYAQKFSFTYDLWILANTPTALIQKTNV